jgi:LacI family transcriptional regulator
MMGYVPQGAGRALVSRETFTIGAIISQIGASAFAKTIEALRTQLSKAGYTLLLAQPTEGNISSIGPLRVLIERGVDAVVLLGGGGKYLDDWKYLLEKNNIPFPKYGIVESAEQALELAKLNFNTAQIILLPLP